MPGKENLEPAEATGQVEGAEGALQKKKATNKLETRTKKIRVRQSGERGQKQNDGNRDDANTNNGNTITKNEDSNTKNTTINKSNNYNLPQQPQFCWECELTRRYLLDLWSAAEHGSVLEREQKKLKHAKLWV